MQRFTLGRVLLILSMVCSTYLMADTTLVMEDGGIKVGQEELKEAAKYWPSGFREAAVQDKSVRYDLLNQFMINRKIAEKIKSITKETDPEFYWQREFAIRNLQNKLYLKYFKDHLKVPDMTALAKERLKVNRKKYALIPEEREVSHILFRCVKGKCDDEKTKEKAQAVFQKLKSGANFEKLVEKYSEDPISKVRNGKLRLGLKVNSPRVDPYFLDAVFKIKKEGDYSGVIGSRFGLHIIRLDKIKPPSFKKEEEVLPKIKEELENEYKKLSELALRKELKLSDNAFIDEEKISKILNKYKRNKETINDEKPTLIIKKFKRP